uniref:Subtilisin-like protease n=1 Tax=Aegilops tauschii TaxID=37682 RepID=R7WD41_AEGTA
MARFSELRAPCLLLLVFLLYSSLRLQLSQGLKQRRVYIVYLGERQHEDVSLVTSLHHDLLTSVLGSKEAALESIVHSYRYGFSGFSAMLTESQARKIQTLPGVVSVKENTMVRMHTTRSWDFLGLSMGVDIKQEQQPNELLAAANHGDGMIIGVIDSGVWPESQSFADDGYGPPPSKWKGTCQAGANFSAHDCNRKLIGARWYAGPDIDRRFLQAGGNVVHNTSFFGLAAGTARGGAPRARIAVYKACWGTCSTASVLKGIDHAIHDGVDVLSLSLGSTDEMAALGTLGAVTRGIPVIMAAGNDGPTEQTVQNSSPWLLTVAATTVDRSFLTVITLGNNRQFVAQSMYVADKGGDEFSQLLYYFNDRCDPDYINSTDIHGKVVFCYTPGPGSVSAPPKYADIAATVRRNGGKGFIFSQNNLDSLDLYAIKGPALPCVPLDFKTSYQIAVYCNRIGIPKIKISTTRTTSGSEVVAPRIAAFSSRGPSPIYHGVLKPDIAAPGVYILAAAAQTGAYKSLGVSYVFDSGTSMACPHISGIVALLKSVHPDWSPAALKSALMTTAHTMDSHGVPIEANGNRAKIADPFDYGAGSVNPTKAADPGLIYDISASDYLEFFNCPQGFGSNNNCTPPDLNLPSIAIPGLKTSVTVVRTVTNVGQPNAVYKAFLEPPPGVKMAVEPAVLVFSNAKRVQSFKVIFRATRRIQGSYTFGSLAWHDGGAHLVRIPIAVRVVIEELYSDAS